MLWGVTKLALPSIHIAAVACGGTYIRINGNKVVIKELMFASI